MKKKILLFVFVFFISIMKVSARLPAMTSAGNDCESSGTCMLVCNYINVTDYCTNTKYSTSGQEGCRYISIYYDYGSNNFMVGWWNGMRDSIDKANHPKYIGPTTFDNLFWKDSHIHVPTNLNLSYENFTCPSHAYYDEDWASPNNEVCFDNDGNWCYTSGVFSGDGGSGVGTSFKRGEYKSDEKKIDFEDEINSYFKNKALNGVTEETIRNGDYASADDIWNKLIIPNFRKDFLNDNEVPEFIFNSDAFQNGHNIVADKFSELAEKLKDDAKKKLDNGVISEEQYNEIVEIIDNIDDNIEDVGKNVSENIDVVNSSQNHLPVKDVNICSANGNALKVFQVIGYFLLIAKIMVPIILIILGSITLGKAALSNDEKAIMDAAVMFGKKVLIGLIIFFVPTVLDFGLSLVSGVSDTMQKFENCTACIFSPNDSGRCSPRNLQDGTSNNTNGSGGSGSGDKFEDTNNSGGGSSTSGHF